MLPSCAASFRSSSGVSSIRARCATYFTSNPVVGTAVRVAETQFWSKRIVGAGLILVELPVDQGVQFVDRFRGVFTLGTNRQFAARPGRQHHQAHDAFAIHLLAVLLDVNVALEPKIGRASCRERV